MWEVAVILGVLGSSAILLALSFFLKDDHVILRGLKFFLLLLALLYLMFIPANTIHLINANNGSSADASFMALTNLATTQMSTFNYSFAFVIFVLLLYFVVMSFDEAREWIDKFRGIGSKK